MDVVLQIKELEKQFYMNNYGGDWSNLFKIHRGAVPIMISAPHAVNHFSRGKMKYAEMFTGGIAEYL